MPSEVSLAAPTNPHTPLTSTFHPRPSNLITSTNSPLPPPPSATKLQTHLPSVIPQRNNINSRRSNHDLYTSFTRSAFPRQAKEEKKKEREEQTGVDIQLGIVEISHEFSKSLEISIHCSNQTRNEGLDWCSLLPSLVIVIVAFSSFSPSFSVRFDSHHRASQLLTHPIHPKAGTGLTLEVTSDKEFTNGCHCMIF